MIIAKSDSGKTYMFDIQKGARKMYRGGNEIIKFLAKQHIVEIFLYIGDIKLDSPKQYSLIKSTLQGNIFRPPKQPTINSNLNNTFLELPTPQESVDVNNSNQLNMGNTRGTKKRKQQKKLMGTVKRGATTAVLQRKKKKLSKKKKKSKNK